MTHTSRRKFIATTTAAGLVPMIHLRGQGTDANDKITIGFIGVGRRGQVNMVNFLGMDDVQVVAVCDVDTKMTETAKAKVDKKYSNTDCKVFANYEDLLAMEGLDAICLSTADHWHAKIGIAAAKAGVDIFGEKPFTWGLAEGRELVKAVQANKCIWQTGCWQRSLTNFRRFKSLINNKVLGEIQRWECGTPNGWGYRKHTPEEQWKDLIGKPPENIDWKAYCGPAGDVKYHPIVHPWNWRWTNDFGGGQLLDWVGHHVDIAMWSLGLDHTGPISVKGTGKKDPHPVFDVYTQYEYTGLFENGVNMEVRSDFMGTKFTGDTGWIWVNRGKLVASDDLKDTTGNPRHPLLMEVGDDFQQKIPNHYEDFIIAMRSRKPSIAAEEAAHRAASFGQLAIVAIDTDRELKWDPKAERVIGDQEQAAHPRLGSRL